MTTVAAVAAAVRLLGKPLLLLDTCSLFDLARGPTRERFSASQVRSALHLLGRAESNPRDLSIVIAGQVDRELDDRIEQIQEEGRREIQRLDGQLKDTLDVLAAMNIAGASVHWRITPMGYHTEGRALIDRFRNSALIVDDDQAIRERAWVRIENNLAPAKKGKSEAKDCRICETYLSLMTTLRSAGYAEKACMLTGNINDYVESGTTSTPRENLAAEFAQVQLSLATNFVQAQYA